MIILESFLILNNLKMRVNSREMERQKEEKLPERDRGKSVAASITNKKVMEGNSPPNSVNI